MGASRERSACILCGCDINHPRLLDRTIRIVSCARCGLAWRQDNGFQDIVSDIGQSRAILAPLPYSVGMDLPDLPPADRKTPEPGVAEMDEINSLKHPPGAFLNVGSDDVDILETARVCGWRALCRADLPDFWTMAPQYGVPSASATPSSQVADGYDVIRLEGTLERSPDPQAYLRNAACYLNSQGLLVISGADFSAWDFPIRGQGGSLMPMDVPHWFFTPKTFGALLRRCGFTVLRVSTLPDPPRFRIFARRAERRAARDLRGWERRVPPQSTPKRREPVRAY